MSPNIVRVTIAALLAGAAVLYVRWSRDQARNAPVAQKPNCLNNLRQIGLAFRSWSANHDGRYPFEVSTNAGGTRELVALVTDGFDANAAGHFQVLTNEDELRTPLLLVCPQDPSKKPAKKFSELRPENVTYRLRSEPNIKPNNPKQILVVCPMDGNTLYSDGTVEKGPASLPPTASTLTNPPSANSSIKHRFSDFSADERSQFVENFEKRYKPAVYKWSSAYGGHIPFPPEAVTLEKFIERISRDASYGEYIFIINGITLGVADSKGFARVDYLNSPKETRKMATIPDGSQSPIMASPVSKEDITRMIEADGGIRFSSHEIRMTPSGLSGSLNGGVIVNVGGDPRNGASWKYDLVFGPDSQLAFYLRGTN